MLSTPCKQAIWLKAFGKVFETVGQLLQMLKYSNASNGCRFDSVERLERIGQKFRKALWNFQNLSKVFFGAFCGHFVIDLFEIARRLLQVSWRGENKNNLFPNFDLNDFWSPKTFGQKDRRRSFFEGAAKRLKTNRFEFEVFNKNRQHPADRLLVDSQYAIAPTKFVQIYGFEIENLDSRSSQLAQFSRIAQSSSEYQSQAYPHLYFDLQHSVWKDT